MTEEEQETEEEVEEPEEEKDEIDDLDTGALTDSDDLLPMSKLLPIDN